MLDLWFRTAPDRVTFPDTLPASVKYALSTGISSRSAGMWESVVRALAGRWARLEVRPQPPNGWKQGVFARVSVLGGLGGQHAVVGADREDALKLLAISLAQERLAALLRQAGWDVMEGADAEAYVVARDPGNDLWAVGVAGKDDHEHRDWLRRSMTADQPNGQGRTFRPVVVEPLDARDAMTLVTAMESNVGTTRVDSR